MAEHGDSSETGDGQKITTPTAKSSIPPARSSILAHFFDKLFVRGKRDELSEIVENDEDEMERRTFEILSQKSTIDEGTKLSPFWTFVALIKGYCAIVILFVPSAFVHGGWGMSSLLFVLSGVLSAMCVNKLCDAGNRLGIYSYSGVVE